MGNRGPSSVCVCVCVCACMHFTHHIHSTRWGLCVRAENICRPLTVILLTDNFYWRNSSLWRKCWLTSISSRKEGGGRQGFRTSSTHLLWVKSFGETYEKVLDLREVGRAEPLGSPWCPRSLLCQQRQPPVGLRPGWRLWADMMGMCVYIWDVPKMHFCSIIQAFLVDVLMGCSG